MTKDLTQEQPAGEMGGGQGVCEGRVPEPSHHPPEASSPLAVGDEPHPQPCPSLGVRWPPAPACGLGFPKVPPLA